jgi:hypothetical protein
MSQLHILMRHIISIIRSSTNCNIPSSEPLQLQITEQGGLEVTLQAYIR